MVASITKTLRIRRRETQIVSRHDTHKPIVRIVQCVRVAVVAVQPQTVVVVFDVEHVQIAVNVSAV